MNDGERGAPRKKILFGVTRAAWGGAQRYVFDIASNLDTKQYEATVMGGSQGRLIELLKTKNITYKRIDSLDRSINPWKELMSFFSILSVTRETRPDILHLNSPKMAGLGALAGRLAGVPRIITTVHGWSFGKEWNFATRVVIFLFSWISSLLADRIICITRRDIEIARKIPFIREKAVFIPNGITPSDYLSQETARKKLIEMAKLPNDLENEAMWLGTITRFVREKDLETMIRGIAKLKHQIPLIILGTGPDEEKMKALAHTLLPNRIFFLGFVPDAELYLKAFSIFLLTSVKEGLPYVLLEAAGAGVPIIATDVGGVPDIIQNGSSGRLIPPKNPEAFAIAVNECAETPELLAKLSEAGEERIRNGFNLIRMLEETGNLYR